MAMRFGAAIPVAMLTKADALPDGVAAAMEAAGFRVFQVAGAAGLPALVGRIVPDAVIVSTRAGATEIGLCRHLLATSSKLSDTILVTPEDDAMSQALGADVNDVCPWASSPVAVLSAVHRSVAKAQPLLLAGHVRAGPLTLDVSTHQLYRGGRPVSLSRMSYRLLDYLMRRPGRVFTRTQLLNAVWDERETLTRRAVDVQMGRLRRALAMGPRGPIRTVTGAGYFFDTWSRAETRERRDTMSSSWFAAAAL